MQEDCSVVWIIEKVGEYFRVKRPSKLDSIKYEYLTQNGSISIDVNEFINLDMAALAVLKFDGSVTKKYYDYMRRYCC